jgi:hypothetical protein
MWQKFMHENDVVVKKNSSLYEVLECCGIGFQGHKILTFQRRGGYGL